MDRFHTPKRVQSLRRHATYARHIRREAGSISHAVGGGKHHSRKPSLASVTEATVRKSILQLMQHTQEEAVEAAHELAECMDTVFFPKDAEKPPVRHVVALNSYPTKCITVLPEEGDLKDHDGPAPRQRRTHFAMDRLNKHIKQRSLNSLSAHKSTEDGKPAFGRSRSWARFSRALLLKKSSSSDTRRSPPRKSSAVSSTLNHLSNVSSSLKRNLRLNGLPDPYPPIPMVDIDEVPSFQDLNHPNSQMSPPPPMLSKDRQRRTIDRRQIDSAYFSDSQKSVDSLSPDSRYFNEGEDTPAETSTAPVTPTQVNYPLSRAPSFKHDFVLSPSPNTYESGNYVQELHSQQWPLTPKSDSRPTRPRLQTQRFLSADNIFAEGDLSPKPPSPLRERPLLDMEYDHRRTFSNGSNTLEIKVYMDSEREQATDTQFVGPEEQSDRAANVAGEGIVPTPLFCRSLLSELYKDDAATKSSLMSQRQPIHKKKNFPDTPYTPRSNKPGVKLYDNYRMINSHNPTYMHQSVRGESYDSSLADLFDRNVSAQGAVIRRILHSRVVMDDGTCKEPLDVELEKARKYRAGAIS